MDENYEGEELDNIVILNDEDGNEVKFEFLDLVELDEEEYVVLLPVTEEGEEEEGEVVILKVEDNDDEESEEESYVSVEDEDTLNKVFEIFKEKFIHKLKCKYNKIKIEIIDERLTTVAAHKTMNLLEISKNKKRNIVDTISAVYILETYLNKLKNTLKND